MVSVEQVKTLVENFLKDTDYELQTLEIDKDQNILVEVDRLGVVDVDFCADLNRYLVDQLGDTEDYALEVGSVSLTAPFKTKIQYQKNLGHDVELLTGEGKKLHGQLVSVDEETFAVDVKNKKETQTLTFGYGDVKYIRYDLKV